MRLWFIDAGPWYSNLVKCFTTQELMRWPGIESIYGATLQGTSVFGGEEGVKRYKDLHTRVIEHVSVSILLLVCKIFDRQV
jgi:hypothetical protein